MKKNILTLILFAVSFTISNAIFAQDNRQPNHIEVSTRVEKQVTPDVIYVGITIDEQQNKGKVFIETKEKEMIKSLQGLDIDVAKNLTVKDMESDLKKYFLKKDNILSTKSYTLKLSTAAQVAAVFDALNSIGISKVSVDKVSISPELQKQVKDELLVSAAQKAKENAVILAEAVGSKAGKAIYIQNYYSFSQPTVAVYNSRSLKATAMDMVVEESLPTLEISQSTISINVLCKFALE